MSITHARKTSREAIDVTTIEPILARVIERWQPLQIWLFGSRGRGDARVDSDWDLLAIVPDCPEPADFDDPLTPWRVKRQPGVPSDLFVWRASDFADDRDVPNTLAYSASHEGVLVYDLAKQRPEISIQDKDEIEKRAAEARSGVPGIPWDQVKRILLTRLP